MKQHLTRKQITFLLLLTAAAAAPAFSSTIVSSCISNCGAPGGNGTLAEPDQTLTFFGPTESVNVNGPTTFSGWYFSSNATQTGGPTLNFTILLNEPGAPLPFSGNFNTANNTITFTAGGTETVNGTNFVTWQDGNTHLTFGIQSSVIASPGQTATILGLIDPGTPAVTPEPASLFLLGLGLAMLAKSR